MKIILKNITHDSRVSIIDKKTMRVFALLPGETAELVVDNKDDVEQYRRSYAASGIDISIKEEPVEVIPIITCEETKVEKPKRSRKKAEPKAEETPAEEPVVETPAEEPKAEEPAE